MSDRPKGIFLTKSLLIILVVVTFLIGMLAASWIDSQIIGFSCQPIGNDIENTETSKFILIECKLT